MPVEKMTLLAMTQNILSAMNSDEVNSITDTVESQQVADEIHTTFNLLYTNHDLGTFEGLVNLESPGNVSTPHILTLPTNVQFVKWLKYKDFRNSSSDVTYVDLTYIEPELFIKHIVEQTDPASNVNVSLLPTSSITFPIANNRAPKYYTILEDNQNIVFDAFDKSYESFLTGSSSLAWATMYKQFQMNDDFIAPIPASEFPRLLAEAKSACFINLKEIANSNEASRARQQKVMSQRRPVSVAGQKKGALTHVDYSRKR
jgi:hypothetical protein